MSRLHSVRLLARHVLAWFVLAVGVAAAAPLVQPQALQLVCGAGWAKLLPQDGEDAAPQAPTLDCALCAPATVPPPRSFSFLPAAASHPAPAAAALSPAAPQGALRPPVRGPPPALLA